MEQGKGKIKLAIYSSSFLMMGVMAIASGLSAIGQHFSDVPQTSIQLLLTLPCIVIIVVSPIIGKLQEYISMKALVLFGVLCFLVGGVVPGFIESFPATLVFRGILGVGVGTIQVLSSALVAAYFEGDERSKVMGQQTSAQMIGCAVMVFVSGYLAVAGWNITFFVHFLAVISFVLVAVFLPGIKPVRRAKASSGLSEKVSLTPGAIGLAVTLFLFFVGGMILATYMAFFIAGRNLGSPAQAGQATMIFAIGGFLFGLVFGKLMQAVRNVALAVGLFFSVLAFLLIALAPNIAFVYIGSLIFGASLTIVVASIMVATSMSVKPIAVPLAMSVVIAGQNLGSFICPYVITPLSKLLGGDVNTFAFITGAIWFGVMGIVALIWGIAKNAKKPVAVSGHAV